MSQLPASPIRTLILGDSPQATEMIADLLQSEPGFTISVSAAAYGDGARAARQYEPDLIVLLADTLVGADPVVAVEELESAVAGAAIVVLSADSRHTTRDYILAGARDCLAPPYDREILSTSFRQIYVHEMRRRDRLAASLGLGVRQHRCRVIAVHGAKGGVGATTIAVNLAVALRRLTGERVGLLDASLQSGDVGVALNLIGSAGIDDLLPHLNELDADLVDQVLVNHSSGVRALLAPRDLERADSIGAEEIRRIISFLTAKFDYVVADTAAMLDGAGLAVLDHSDQIVLVTTPDIPALKNAGRFLQLTRRLGYPPTKTLLAVNRAGGRHAIAPAEIERSLGWRPAVTIPANDGLFLRAANHGEAVVSASAWRGPSQSLYKLARQVAVTTSGAQLNGALGAVRALGGRLFSRTGRSANGAGSPAAAAKSR